MALEGNVLAGLQEIPLPPPVPYTPSTVGWLVVGVLLLAFVIGIAWRLARHWRANAYRREALAELEAIEREPGAVLQTLPALLKRTAIAATSRERVAALTGRKWLVFLDRTLGGESFSRGTGQLLTRIAYRDAAGLQAIPRRDLDELLRLARRWIRHHHADV